MAVSGSANCLGWQYSVFLLVLVFQASTMWILAIKEPAQPSKAAF